MDLPIEVSPGSPYLKKDFRPNREINRAEFETNDSYRTKARINPAQIYTRQANPAGATAIQPRTALELSPQNSEVSLNPQPLPPAGNTALQTQSMRGVSAARTAQVVSVPALGNSSRSVEPPAADPVPDPAVAAADSPVVEFNPPLLNDGAQLWACVDDVDNEANEQACAGLQSAQDFCLSNGYSGDLALRADGSPGLLIANAQAEVPVRSVNGDSCFGASCQVISELGCMR